MILGGILFISFLGIGITGDKTQSARTNSQEQTVQTPTNTPTLAPTTPPLSKEDQIKAMVKEQLKGTNNMKRNNLKKVEVTEQEGGGWNVTVDFNADDNLTTNLRKVGIEKEMSELYITLYKSGKDVSNATITAYFPLVDQYGKENDRAVYQSTLDKAEASKVNWNADQSSLKLSILPKVWTTTLLHPEFK